MLCIAQYYLIQKSNKQILAFIFHEMRNRFREEKYFSINFKNMRHLLFSIFKDSEKNIKIFSACLMQSFTEKRKSYLFLFKDENSSLMKFLKIYIKTKDLYSMKQFYMHSQFFTYLLFVYLLTSLTFQCIAI